MRCRHQLAVISVTVFMVMHLVTGRTATAPAQENRPAPRLLFYHDGRHPLIYMYEPPMQKEEFEAGVDELAGTPVQIILFCMGDGRTVLHDTQVGELWGHNVDKWSHLIFRRAHQNAKHLIEQGHDPLRIICERAHAKGFLLYPVLLVQQGRGVRGQDMRGSNFRFDNPHLEIGAAGDLDPDFPAPTNLDFKHRDVRDERFALIEETLNKYPVDGFELNLNYSPYYFHPEQMEAGRQIMTDWIERVYRAVKKSGSRRELAIRVPASLDGCWSVGLDVKEWIRRGIVDLLIPQGAGGPELIDSNIDFRPFARLTKDSPCGLYPALHSHIDSDRLANGNTEIIRAAACNYWDQGIDGLYLAHWFGYWPYQAEFYEKLRELPHPDIMAPKDKHYHLLTTTGRYQEPLLEPGLTRQLPADLELNEPVTLQMRISDDLPRWDKVGRVHEVLLRLRISNVTELDHLTFQLNGQPLPDSLLRKLNQMYRMSAPRYHTGSAYWFIFKLDKAHWPHKGENTIEVALTQRDPAATPTVFIRDVELETKYLMGKHFHRGQDVDLGPSEYGAP